MRLCSLAFALVACSLAPAQTSPAPVESAPPLLARVVCIGASASGGYGLSSELKTRVKIGLLLDQLLPGERRACVDLGSVNLFQAPRKLGADQVEAALDAEATLVVAVDFLFWFSYRSQWGRERNDDRAVLLEQGLALLDRFECPILLGDLPDMRVALHGVGPFGGPLLVESMIPSPEQLVTFNARIRDWARERGDTTLVPMAEFVRRATAGEMLEVRGNRWDAKQIRNVLQKDLLHPTTEGSFGLLVLGLDRLVNEREDLSSEHVLWDVSAARKRLHDATAEGRNKTLARERKREERRLARKARRKAAEEAEKGGGGGLVPLPVPSP